MSWKWRQWRAECWVQDRQRVERWQRRRRRFGRFVAFLGLLLIGGPGAFIGLVCSGGGIAAAARADRAVPDAGPRRVADLPAVPERLVVAQTDEYARHLARARPSTFPHFTAARDYWGAVSTACGVTTQEYAFNAGQQITLGMLGAGHTAEQVAEGRLRRHAGPLHRVALLDRHARGSLRRRDRRASWPASSAARRGSSSRSAPGCSSCGRARRCGAARHPQVGAARRAQRSSTASRRCARRPPGWWPRRRRQGHGPPARLGRRRDAGRAAGQRRRDRVDGRAGSFIVTLPRGDAFTRAWSA